MADGADDRRTSPRVAARCLVEVKLPSWEALRAVYTTNISLGGMRLALGARPPLGAAIDVILTLPDGNRIHLAGQIAHFGAGDGGDAGVRFDALPARTEEAIRRYLSDLDAGRAPAARPPGDIPTGTLIKKR